MTDIGKIGWIDLTAHKADDLQDFYSQVTGWKSEKVNVGDYFDFNMCKEDGEAVAGICHKRGSNEGIPTNWMVYIVVADLAASLETCVEKGGELVRPITSAGPNGQYAIIRDPAGAVCALYQSNPKS